MTRSFWRYSPVVLFAVALLPASAQLLDPTSLNVSATSSNTTAATVLAGNASGQIAIVADPVTAGGDLFDVIVSDPAAVVSLQIPGGTVVTSANAANLGYAYTTYTNPANVSSTLAGPFNLAGTHTVFLLPPSQLPGTYIVIVNASTTLNPVLVIATFVTSSPVRAGATTTQGTYKVGDTVVITGMVFNGNSPVTDATVIARVVDNANLTGNPSDIPLPDSGQYDAASGDGLYTGTYTAASTGKFLVVVKATGVAPTGNYVRTATASFTVVPAMAKFTAFSDTGVDDNGNGKPDRVVVSAAISVQQAATYQVGIALQATNGNVLKTSVTSALTAGNQVVPLSFKATDIINKLAVNGPYALRDVTLVALNGINNPMVDYIDNEGNTAAYLLSSLDPGSQLYFTGQNTVTGVDTNADGKFDILRVQAGVMVPSNGSYSWSANLVNSKGQFITLYDTSAFLSAGSSTINFDFRGADIGQTCSSGVFSVLGALVFGPASSAVSNHLLNTPTFTASQFTNTACFLVSATPSSGSVAAGMSQPFTFSYTDSNGAADLAQVSMLINSSTAPGNACNVAWFRTDHTIRLYNDDGFGGYTYAPDDFNSFGNSQCTISYNNPVVASGNNLTLSLTVSFTKTFAGKQNVYMEAQNAGGTDSGLQLYGALAILPTSPCDVDGTGVFTANDGQSILSQALGTAPPANDPNGNGIVNVADVQNVLNAVIGGACVTH